MNPDGAAETTLRIYRALTVCPNWKPGVLREEFRKEALWGEHKRRRVLLARKARQKPGEAEPIGSSSGSRLEDTEVDRSFTEERGFQQPLPGMGLFTGLWSPDLSEAERF